MVPISPATGLQLFVLLHAVLAIVTLYVLLRELGCGRLAALAGGLAYGLSGSFAARAAQVSLVCAQAWVPAALGGFFLALRRDSLGGLVMSAIAVGFIGLSGSPATLVLTLMDSGCCCRARCWATRAGGRSGGGACARRARSPPS